MEGNLSKYKTDLDRLIKLSDQLYTDLAIVAAGKKVQKGESEPGQIFHSSYQQWYSEAREVIRQILPSRLNEFETLYQGNEKRKDFNAGTYTIKDWLLGIRARQNLEGVKYFDDSGAVFMRYQTQVQILKSATVRFQSSLLDIRQILQADLFDSEVESAKELLKKGFLRASGAVVGVVAEKHLEQVCNNHNIRITKKAPTISFYNDALKKEGVIEVPEWRFIQRLGDLRNLCDHNKEREPTEDEVNELIIGVDKLTKTIF